jgi:mono/diheme cytochrome c family protein
MKTTWMTLVSALAAASLALTACGDKDEGGSPEAPKAGPAPTAGQPPTPTPPPPSADAAAEAKQIFATRCQTCHGPSGQGDGPAAASLNPPPQNYANAEWQAGITDERIADAIVKGGAAVGSSPMMPPNPDLAAKPEVVAELVKMVRGFGEQE